MEEPRALAIIESIESTIKTLTFLVAELDKELKMEDLEDLLSRLGVSKDSGGTYLPEALSENGEDG
jgi:hypothetical protein